MEIKGKILDIRPVEQINNHSKQTFLLEVSSYETIAIIVWDDKLTFLSTVRLGEEVSVNVKIKSREFNGKFYTDVVFVSGNSVNPIQATPQQQYHQQPQYAAPQQYQYNPQQQTQFAQQQAAQQFYNNLSNQVQNVQNQHLQSKPEDVDDLPF